MRGSRVMERARLASVVLWSLSLLAAGCERTAPKPAPPDNLLIITFDTCRADHVGTFGYDRDTTPNIDAFAARSVAFSRAYSTAASTAPALSSLMTSKYPHQHGVIETYRFALSDGEWTLAERMADAGRKTAAVLGIGVLMPSRNLNQGFEHYSFTRYTNKQYWKTAPEITKEAVEWLDANHSEPFFMWVHYFEPHQPYRVVPEEALERFKGTPSKHPMLAGLDVESARYRHAKDRVDQYDGALAYADRHFGELVATLEKHSLFDNTMVVFTSDHGETIGEHGQHGHVFGLWEPVVNVPMVIYRPGVVPARVSENASLVDVVPTVIEHFDLEPDPELHGRVMPLAVRTPSGRVSKPAPFPQADAFAETWFKEQRVGMLNSGRWKYILTTHKGGESSGQLYDLENDPTELNDIAKKKAQLASQLEADLRAWMVDEFTTPGMIKEKPGELEMLEALGYLQ